MLQNEYLDAKIGFDTAENEPSEALTTSSYVLMQPQFFLIYSSEDSFLHLSAGWVKLYVGGEGPIASLSELCCKLI